MLEQIDFGQLSDPIETVKKRAAFCSKVVVAKPIVEEITTRMLREIGRTYFGNTRSLEELAYVNGMVQFATQLKNLVLMLESEHLSKQHQEEEEENSIISSGSNLEL